MFLPGLIKDVCIDSRRGGNVFSDFVSGQIRIAAPFITIEDFRQAKQPNAVARPQFTDTMSFDDLNSHDTVRSWRARLVGWDIPADQWDLGHPSGSRRKRREMLIGGHISADEQALSHPSGSRTKRRRRLIDGDISADEWALGHPSVSRTKGQEKGGETRQTPSAEKYPELNSWIRSQWRANPAFRSEFNQKHSGFEGREFAILIIGKSTRPYYALGRPLLQPCRSDAEHFLLLVLESAQPGNRYDPHKIFRRIGILQLNLKDHFDGIWRNFHYRFKRILMAPVEEKAEAEKKREAKRNAKAAAQKKGRSRKN
jgi:hypothetical protein